MTTFIKVAILIALVQIYSNSVGQIDRPYITPSPNSLAMTKFADIQVGSYTGVPDITVPLAVLPGKDISIPVSVDYHASGIKVQDVAGPVGLGWFQNSGGAITRIVRGMPDDARLSNGTMVKSCIAQIPFDYKFEENSLELCDGEKDIFYFSFLGRVGKFFIDSDRTIPAYAMPYQDILISTPDSDEIATWSITDENGYIYNFGGDALNRESTSFYVGNANTNSFTKKQTFTSTWYLTSITNPAGENVANFVYSAGQDISYLMYAEKFDNCNSSPGSSFITIPIDTKISILQPKYLASITTGLSSALFTYDGRSDLPGAKKLTSISVRDISKTEKRKIYLDFDYFGWASELGNLQCKDGYCNNLKLVRIREGITSPVVRESFDYNEKYLLPIRNEIFTDHYGYFNLKVTDSSQPYNNPSENFIQNVHSKILLESPCPFGRPTKEPTIAASACVLTGISYATGKKIIFSYALNSYSQVQEAVDGRSQAPLIMKSKTGNGKGIRVSDISTFDGTTLIDKVSYSYANGQAYALPIYSYMLNGYLSRVSDSYNALNDIDGVSLGYSTVTETFLDGSKIVRDYTNFSDYLDKSPKVDEYTGSKAPVLKESRSVYGPPFTPNSSNSSMRGLLKSEIIYDNLGHALQQTEKTYKQGMPIASVDNQVVMRTGTITFIAGRYTLNYYPVYLETLKTTLYSQDDYTSKIVQLKTFKYHSVHKTFPNEIVSQTGTGPEQKTSFRYPIDVVGSASKPATMDERAGGIWGLIDNHMITSVETIVYNKDYDATDFKIIGGELNAYGKLNDGIFRPVLRYIYKLNIGAPLTSLNTFATLTSSGSVFSYDNTHYRLMQTNEFYPGTKRLASVTSSQGIVINYDYDQSSNYTLVGDQYLESGNMVYGQSYKYNTIDGITQMADVNNLTTKYEYDASGRWRLIKDNDGNILSRRRYNFQNQNEYANDFMISYELPKIGQTISFSSVLDAEKDINTTYTWNFGDNQTVTGTSRSVTHSYTVAKTYIVTLTKNNPQQGSLVTKHSITIN